MQLDTCVFRSNFIIQNSRHNLTANELKCLTYITARLDPAVFGKETEYVYSIDDFKNILGITSTGGKAYMLVKDAVQGLRDKIIYVRKTPSTGFSTEMHWLRKADVPDNTGMVLISVSENMLEYVYGLKKRFVIFLPDIIYSFKHSHSIRLYEILKSYQNLGRIEIELHTIKEMMMFDTKKGYDNYCNFNTKVLKSAIDEINLNSDIHSNYEPIKSGNKVIGIKFTISKKKGELSCC